MTDRIRSYLSPDHPWASQILYLPVVSSTNDSLRMLACQGAPHGTALFAGFQTGGKGRLGRSFHSPEGKGIYMSLLLRPQCAPCQLMHLTCATAVAMCDALEKAAGFRPGIKWTNDLVWGRKKLGGILTELKLTQDGNVDFAIIGIGINCSHTRADFPEALQDMAASLEMATGRNLDPAALAAAMLESLQAMDDALLTDREALLRQYRRDCITIGQEISVVRGDTIRHGKALDVDSEGALVVEYADGTREAVNSGEVSIRGMYGYI